MRERERERLREGERERLSGGDWKRSKAALKEDEDADALTKKNED
jgi:hypothetical protein